MVTCVLLLFIHQMNISIFSVGHLVQHSNIFCRTFIKNVRLSDRSYEFRQHCVHMLRGDLTLIDTVNALEASFPTSIVSVLGFFSFSNFHGKAATTNSLSINENLLSQILEWIFSRIQLWFSQWLYASTLWFWISVLLTKYYCKFSCSPLFT